MEIVDAKEVSCESVIGNVWSYSVNTVKTCNMHTTSISEAGVTFSTLDESVLGIFVNNNEAVSFLPEKVNEKFPNLLGYCVQRCSIKEISKKNFEQLTKLKILYLHDNQIEKIGSETFGDLKDLEQLFLRKIIFFLPGAKFYFYFFSEGNKIKFLNGKLFIPLKKLKEVNLASNVCINENFNNPTKIATLQQTVNEKCHFDESEIPETATEQSVSANDQHRAEINALQLIFNETKAKLKTKTEALETQTTIDKSQITLLKAQLEVVKTQLESSPKTREIEECKSTVADLKADKLQYKQQLDMFQKLHEDLKLQWNATCISETRELRNNFDFKLQENADLAEKVQLKETEIVQKNEEIKKLKEKIEMFGQF